MTLCYHTLCIMYPYFVCLKAIFWFKVMKVKKQLWQCHSCYTPPWWLLLDKDITRWCWKTVLLYCLWTMYMLHVAMQESVCGEGWFNLCTLITGVSLTLARWGCLNQPSSTHTSQHQHYFESRHIILEWSEVVLASTHSHSHPLQQIVCLYFNVGLLYFTLSLRHFLVISVLPLILLCRRQAQIDGHHGVLGQSIKVLS